jgi:hypothetical protein
VILIKNLNYRSILEKQIVSRFGTFDERLSFDYQTEKLSKTVSKKVGTIYGMRKFLLKTL